jgi:GNAT superfamily N-acetyltransferase
MKPRLTPGSASTSPSRRAARESTSPRRASLGIRNFFADAGARQGKSRMRESRILLLQETVCDAYFNYARAPAVETGEEDVRWVLTGAGYEGLNAILFSSAATATDVERALEPFRTRGVRLLWHLVPTNADDTTEEQLIASGLRFYEEEPGMVAQLSGTTQSEDVPGLQIDVVRDEQELRRCVEIWTGTTNASFLTQVTRLRSAGGVAEDATFQHLIGRLNGRPVATAAVAHGSRASEIQHVVTLQDVRRRGIGTTMTAAAMDLARRRGHDHAVLTSSPEGEGLYRNLGFETVCRVRRFIWKPPLV